MGDNYEIPQAALMAEKLAKLRPNAKSDPVMAKISTALLKNIATLTNERLQDEIFANSKANDVRRITE